MRRVELADAAEILAGFVQERPDAPVILTDHGAPVAALIPIAGMDWETIAVSTSPTFQAIMERSRSRRRTEGGIAHDELLRRLGMSDRAELDQVG